MRIDSIKIKNYRSIKSLKLNDLTSINVFFGKNNVGKSNILRGMNLAFRCLKDDKFYLPDTSFYVRNIYKPIEIVIDLTLEEDFCDIENIKNILKDRITKIESFISENEIFKEIIDKIDRFGEKSNAFDFGKKINVKIEFDYNEKTSDVKIFCKDLKTNKMFNYTQYKNEYKNIKNIVDTTIRDREEKIIDMFTAELTYLGLKSRYLREIRHKLKYARERIDSVMEDVERSIEMEPPKRGISRDKISESFRGYKSSINKLSRQQNILNELLSNVFNLLKEYFDKISDNFIFIPNKEYFPKCPWVEKSDKPEYIELFDIKKFENKLSSLIESPGKKERALIEKFNSIFTESYADLGELEIRKFRESVFAIFSTGYTSLPIENQGLGVQDIYLYTSHMILFNSAIVAIEEPEGGLSTENQKILFNITEDVYTGSDKQIFITSHSEVFETPNSYILEITSDGTNIISRIKEEEKYEKKIDDILIVRKIAEEKKEYEVLLKEVTEKQLTLDILNYINKLGEEDKIDIQDISKALGIKKEKVKEILDGIKRK